MCVHLKQKNIVSKCASYNYLAISLLRFFLACHTQQIKLDNPDGVFLVLVQLK